MRVQDRKTRILLASVLKPVDEPRMCERMGQSLAKYGFEVFIAGFPASSSETVEGVTFLPHGKFKRISVSRIKARFTILRKAFSVNPDILVVTTHELIGIAILFKLFSGKKIIYDIQEDYFQNITHTNAWPKLFRPFIAFPVRWKEWITSSFFSKFLLAEKCYEDDLGFARGKSVVIENKCVVPPGFYRMPSKDTIQLLFTGTIAESTGIFEAINLTKKLHEVEPRIKLTIIGHCAQPNMLQKIEMDIAQSPFIRLVGRKDFVPHNKIIEAISSANFGIISYPPSSHTKDKIPSKLYEYLACQLPILLQENKRWVELCAHSNAAIAIDFQHLDATAILSTMRESQFYLQRPENVSWESEEKTLIAAIHSYKQG